MPKKADPTKGLSIRQCEKTGEWIARVAVFTPPDTPQQRFKNMMDAVRYQRKLKENYKRDARMRSGQKGVSISDAKKAVKCPTLEQLVTRFFKDYENDKGRPHTSIDKFITQSQRSKNIAHVKLLRPMLKKPVDQITPKEVSDWFNLFRTTPKSNGKLQTISNCKKQKGWYAEAYRKYKKEYNLEINPFEGKYLYPKKSDGSIVEAWHKGNHHEKTSVFTDEQIEAFREYGREWVCYKTYERPKYVEDEIFFAFEIALATGMRLQEVLRVELDEIDVKGKSVFISASKCKEKRDKTIILFGDSLDIYLSLAKTAGDNKYLFRIQSVAGDASELDEGMGGASAIFKKRLEELDMTHDHKGETLTFHSLRRNFATRKANQNFPLTLLHQTLGHSDIEMTMKYYDKSSLEKQSYNLWEQYS